MISSFVVQACLVEVESQHNNAQSQLTATTQHIQQLTTQLQHTQQLESELEHARAQSQTQTETQREQERELSVLREQLARVNGTATMQATRCAEMEAQLQVCLCAFDHNYCSCFLIVI